MQKRVYTQVQLETLTQSQLVAEITSIRESAKDGRVFIDTMPGDGTHVVYWEPDPRKTMADRPSGLPDEPAD